MKTWFIYLVNGKKVAVWVNNSDEGYKRIKKKYGDIPIQFLGMKLFDDDTGADEYLSTGMTSVDFMIASGILDYFSMLRYAR